MSAAVGPLAKLKIVEFAGIGPGPFCAMLLAELGAKVIRIDRREASGLGVPKPPHYDLLLRGRKAFALDLKREQGVEAALRLVDRADVLIEGFRPGVMERLGLGPQALLARNPRLVYGRMTGWGQEGPLAQAAGHDLNYIAIGGALHSIGRPGAPPSAPLNLVGDYAGAVYLAFGIVSAILSARETGRGTGRRRRHLRHVGAFDDQLLRPGGGRRLLRRTRDQCAGRRRAVL